jgi:hypothetical protein
MDRDTLVRVAARFDCVCVLPHICNTRLINLRVCDVFAASIHCASVRGLSLEFYCKVNLRSPETMGARARFLDAAHAAHFCLAAILLFCDATAPQLSLQPQIFVCFGLLGAAGAAQNKPLTHTSTHCV